MKGLVFVALYVAFASVVLARPEEQYTDEFDNIDHKEVFKSERLYKNYLGCLEKGEKCTPAGKTLRDLLPDALQTNCVKCTPTQKTKANDIVQWIAQNNPNDYLTLEKIYDPNRQYRVKYADKLKELGVVLPN